MPIQLYVRTLVTFIHDLLTAVWIGGLFMINLTLMPAARKALGNEPEMLNLMEKVKQNHRRFIYVAIPGLLITGMFLGRSNTIPKGLLSFHNPYDTAMTIKLVLLVLMTIIAIIRSRRSPQSDKENARKAAIPMLANLVLGLIVLLLSGYMDSVAGIIMAGK